MKADSVPAGKIITFYSYKGGTGRSMAVANTACLLAKHLSDSSQRVLVMDWDLEAPGLHRFFGAQLEKPDNIYRPGVIDYFTTLQTTLQEKAGLYEAIEGRDGDGIELLEKILPLENYVVRDVAPGVDLIKAGKLNKEYAEAVNSFHWADFFKNYGSIIEPFRDLLASRYAYCLIDSRTGFSDVSGVCTMLLPEKLVTVFIPNRQNLSGVIDLSVRAIDYRRESSDFRPLAIFPLPSRIENAEHELKQTWRKQYQQEFEETFRGIYQMDRCELTNYFNEVQLPYQPYYAYGEKIAVLEERSDALSLSKAYRVFFQRLIELDFAWDTSEQIEKSASEVGPPVETFANYYDVFLDYEFKDAQFVGALADLLGSYKIRQFDAAKDVLPGEAWQATIEKAISSSKTVAIFIGRPPTSPARWEQIQSQLDLILKTPDRRIIPVLLPDADWSALPPFLRSLSAVDFTSGLQDPDAFLRLLSGITGRKIEEKIPLSTEQSPKQSRITESPALTPRDLHFQAVVRNITEGRLVPFFGPGVNQANRPAAMGWKLGEYLPTSNELASYLAETFGYSEGNTQDLARVSQVISLVDGSGPLYEALHHLYDLDYPPTSLHNFFAALPSMMREKGLSLTPLLLVTTNYDDLLERAFRALEEPFDLVLYVAEGENQGRFLHRTPDGDEHLIEKPNEYAGLDLERRTVILKIHGAVDRKQPDRDSFMITEDDHINYVTRAYSASRIPAVLAAKLRRSYFLFLGYSLNDWTMRSILQSIRGEQKVAYKSWAIQWDANSLDAKFWAQRDIEMFNMQLDEYTESLWQRLRELSRTIQSA